MDNTLPSMSDYSYISNGSIGTITVPMVDVNRYFFMYAAA